MCSSGAHTHYQPIEKIMEFTIICTRVPIPQGTTLYGTPVNIVPAPTSPDVVLDHAAPEASNDILNISRGRYLLSERGQLHVLQSLKTSFVAKIVLFSALSILAPSLVKGI